MLQNRININMGNLYGQSALHLAAMLNFAEGTMILLEHKANIDIRDNLGYTPLHVGVIFNSKECVELLLNRGAAPNVRSNPQSGGVSPLHLAACLGYAVLITQMALFCYCTNIARRNVLSTFWRKEATPICRMRWVKPPWPFLKDSIPLFCRWWGNIVCLWVI